MRRYAKVYGNVSTAPDRSQRSAIENRACAAGRGGGGGLGRSCGLGRAPGGRAGACGSRVRLVVVAAVAAAVVTVAVAASEAI